MKELTQECKDLWESLGDVPVNDDNELELDWHIFSEGTHTNDIWLWFEDKFDISVAVDLMYL